MTNADNRLMAANGNRSLAGGVLAAISCLSSKQKLAKIS